MNLLTLDKCKSLGERIRREARHRVTKDELLEFHRTSQDTCDHIFWRCYSVIGCSFGLRSAEPHLLEFQNIKRAVDENDQASYTVSYKRSKQRGKLNKGDTFSRITGELEVGKEIAIFLHLPNPDQYTGQCCRDDHRAGPCCHRPQESEVSAGVCCHFKGAEGTSCRLPGPDGCEAQIVQWPVGR